MRQCFVCTECVPIKEMIKCAHLFNLKTIHELRVKVRLILVHCVAELVRRLVHRGVCQRCVLQSGVISGAAAAVSVPASMFWGN